MKPNALSSLMMNLTIARTTPDYSIVHDSTLQPHPLNKAMSEVAVRALSGRVCNGLGSNEQV